MSVEETLNDRIEAILQELSASRQQYKGSFWEYGHGESAADDMREAMSYARSELDEVLKQPITADEIPRVIDAVSHAKERYQADHRDEIGAGGGHLTDLMNAIAKLRGDGDRA